MATCNTERFIGQGIVYVAPRASNGSINGGWTQLGDTEKLEVTTNQNFVEFVKEFRNHFRQEPDKIYAALGYDIMMYFVPVIQNKGKSFSKEPNEDRSKFMINSYLFDRRDPNDGWQNRRTVIYKISDYKIISVGR